ncbi:hypothetical protein GWK47_030851 [Chionoecetes opilio]|uniref:Uncharacterized protein n=1 Tax=Chionoecetes opilio TaxID=41210 RepID=A0A8J4YRH4_CHIOP|nr:hypothetical protein GWK47_030851 [Chionoecetes opilio]
MNFIPQPCSKSFGNFLPRRRRHPAFTATKVPPRWRRPSRTGRSKTFPQKSSHTPPHPHHQRHYPYEGQPLMHMGSKKSSSDNLALQMHGVLALLPLTPLRCLPRNPMSVPPPGYYSTPPVTVYAVTSHLLFSLAWVAQLYRGSHLSHVVTVLTVAFPSSHSLS